MESIIIYRNNDLFEKYVSQAVGNIQTKVFPKGTSEGTIQKWMEENGETLLKNKRIIIDETCMGQLKPPYNRYDNTNLDDILFYCLRSFLGEEILSKQVVDNEYQADRNNYVKTLSLIIRFVLRSGNTPKQVVLLKDNLLDHCWGKGEGEIIPKLKSEYKREGRDWGVDKINNTEELITAEIIKAVKEGLVGGGISAEKITVDEIGCETKKLLGLDKEGFWVVADRHCAYRNYIKFQRAKLLYLPHGNLVETVAKEGLITVEESEESLVLIKLKELLSKSNK